MYSGDINASLWLCYRNEERDVNTGGQDSSTGTKKVLILFIGGCTYAEISALRFLSQQEESTTEYSVATTSMINGNNFISGLTTELNDALTPFWKKLFQIVHLLLLHAILVFKKYTNVYILCDI